MAQNIVFKVSADTTGIKTGMEQAGQATKKVSKEVSILDKQFKQLGAATVAAFAVGSVIAFGKAVFAATAEVQSLQARLNSLYGSEQGGAKALNELNVLANKLGLNFLDLSNNFVQFTAAAKASGMEVRQAEKIFKSMSVAIAGSGASAEQGRRAMVALTQMIGKGKISAEELRGQLGEALPSAMGIMAKSMGVSVQKLGDMMEKGQLLSNEVLPKFAKEMEKAFGADAEKLANGLTAATNRLENSWNSFLANIVDSKSATGFIDLLAKSVDALSLSVAVLDGRYSDFQTKRDKEKRLVEADEATRQVVAQIQKEAEAYGDVDLAIEELTKKYNSLLNEVEAYDAAVLRERNKIGGGRGGELALQTKEFDAKRKVLEILQDEIDTQKQSQQNSITSTKLTKEQTKELEKQRQELEKINELELERLLQQLKDAQIDPFQSQLAEATYDAEQEAQRQKNVEKMLGEIGQENSKINDLRNAQGDYEILEAKRIADEKADIAKQEKALRIQLAESTFSGIASLANAYYQNDLAKQAEALNERRKKGEIGEEEYDKAITKIKRKAFLADQIAALSQIAISTAINIASVQNASSLGALTPLYLTNAAIQAGIVLAQPVPYNKGTKRVPMMRNAVRGKDSVHAILTPDERVVPADINSQPGYSALLDLAHDRKITNEEAGMIASIAMGSSRSGAGSNIDSDALGRSIAKHLPTTSVNINDRGIAIITERSQSEIRRLKTRIG
jgi:tape measure domain-containing protein